MAPVTTDTLTLTTLLSTLMSAEKQVQQILQAQPTPTPVPVPVPLPPPPPAPSAARLIQKEHLVYQGAFRVPFGYDYSGGALAFNPTRGTLLMVGHTAQQLVGEFAIPEARMGTVATLATAPVIEPLRDVLEGRRLTVDGDINSSVKIGGLWPFGDKLAVTVWDYYDANGAQTLSHFVRPLNLSLLGSVKGPMRTTAPKAGYVAGAFASIPASWRLRLGGSVLHGLSAVPIISRSSLGPSAWTIDPTQMGSINPVPVTPLVYYPIDNSGDPANQHYLGKYGTDNPYYNGTGGQQYPVFPTNGDSLLFIGTHGTGSYCYGEGGATEPAGAVHWCKDPISTDKGPHGYPYVYRVWAYDAKDLETVRIGMRKPWEVKPYAYWDLPLPEVWRSQVTGVAYDPSTSRLFVGQGFADGASPLIHVYTVTL